jgi:hypothetical protein
MSNDKKQDIEHRRAEIRGAQGSGLEKTIYEHRGVRALVIEIFSDIQTTIVAADLKGTPSDAYDSLMKASNCWLRDAGELTFFDMAELADRAKQREPEGEHKAIDDSMFKMWAAQIGEKRGYLSPEAIAANFVSASDYLHRRLGDDPELAQAVYAFAEAYHWCHFEGYGEHELAALGLASAKGRAAGPQAVRQQREQKQRITQDALNAFAADPKNAVRLTAQRAAADLLPVINESLSALKLRPYSISSLEKVLRPLLKVRGASG